MNKVLLTGRFTKDPEIRTLPSGSSLSTFCVAINRKYKSKDKSQPDADFIDCKAFGQTADFIHTYFTKGMKIEIVGRLEKRVWQAKDGSNRYSTEVICEEVDFAESKNNRSEESNYNSVNYQDSELPFNL